MICADTGLKNGILSSKESIEELRELARSAGAVVVGSLIQKVKKPSRNYLGLGKIELLVSLANSGKFDTIISDDELTPTQQKNLESFFGGKIKVMPIKSVANPGKIKSIAAKANAAPEIISYTGNSFFTN